MTHKLWPKKLKLNYSKDVIDIVQYGSSVIEGTIPNDIDIAVIYNKIPLKEQLEFSQSIKKQLQEHVDIKIHIKSFDLYSLFDLGNFAKESILFYGKSIITGNEFSNRFGLSSRLQISYSLQQLEKKDKVKFHYLLKGKKNSSGLLNIYSGELIKPGLIEILPEHEKVFVDKIKEITDEFVLRKIFIEKK